MFAIALIIFREVLEIALILGILMAATRGLAKRTQWVWVGFFGGVGGAALVALFADRISQSFQGMGQEVMNAAILLTAAALIGWTVLWMARHAQELTREFKAIGQAVIKKERPIHTLAVVVGLSVLREGSEIVMFIYSALVTGGKAFDLSVGFFIGGCAGAALGLIIYYGLMKVPTRQIFGVTSWMLILLTAGMVSHAFGYLTAAGKVPEIIPVLWDTTRIMSQDSLAGRVLSVLTGYTARPSGIQILMYGLTLLTLGTFLKICGRHRELSSHPP
ncbi:MAG: FTR1 family protein [Candidatus Omnitrophica bacterium]|nr:FTR1 family protein [Candidatus Omnitrophota bacterium]